MALKKVYLAGIGPFLVDDAHAVNDPEGDWSGEDHVGVRTDSQMIATEFLGIPISSVSVVDIDDPSDELNTLSASTVGGLIAIYQSIGAAADEFTMYLWDTDAGVENVPYTVDGNGGTWIAVGGKYRNGDVYVSGDINYGGDIGNHHATHENGGGDEISVTGLSGLLADDQHVLDTEVDARIDIHDADSDAHPNVYKAPASITVNTGSLTGTISDAQTLLDGNVVQVDEVTGTPGYDIEFGFTAVTDDPRFLVFRLHYDGIHNFALDIYNYNSTVWDRFHTILGGVSDYVWLHIDIPDPADYIDGSDNANIRLYHIDAGNAAHIMYIDYVALVTK